MASDLLELWWRSRLLTYEENQELVTAAELKGAPPFPPLPRPLRLCEDRRAPDGRTLQRLSDGQIRERP
jgi:hypothetical protein